MKRINISSIICENIKSEFISNKIAFGEQLSEANLAKQLNVSRTPLREAIKILENEGLIVRLANGRIRMIDVDIDDVIEIFQVRLALENTILKSNANSKEFLELLKENIHKSKIFLDSKLKDEARNEISKFTQILYSYIRLSVTKNMLNSYNVILQKFKTDSLASDQRIIEALKEHQMIYEALQNNNYELACKINKKHVEGACQEIINCYFTQTKQTQY